MQKNLGTQFAWQMRDVAFKFQLSDWTLFRASIRLQLHSIGLAETGNADGIAIPGEDHLLQGSQGFALRRLPVDKTLPRLARSGPFLRYVPLQYQHCYIDLGTSFDDYQKKFSSKTRSTINRKIRKYTEHCGGALKWHSYRGPEEIPAFFELARAVSKLTYQEKLLDAGLPDTPEFMERSRALAAGGQLRAYVLFDGERPVSYLYCPVQDGVAIYAYLGYDPAYMHLWSAPCCSGWCWSRCSAKTACATSISPKASPTTSACSPPTSASAPMCTWCGPRCAMPPSSAPTR